MKYQKMNLLLNILGTMGDDLMKNEFIDDLISSRKSIFYYTDLQGEGDPFLDKIPKDHLIGYPSVLIRDVKYGVLPSDNYKVTMVPPNKEIEILIGNGLNERYHRNFERAVSNLIRDCANSIMAFGEAVYEIIYFTDPIDTKIVGFKLGFIQPKTVMWQKDKLVQYIPQKLAEKYKANYIELSPESILIFKLSDDLQSKIERIMKELISLDKPPVVTEFLFQENGKKVPYNVNEHIHTQNVAIAKTGSVIGWIPSNISLKFNEYYDTYQFLSFQEFIIKLRNIILQTLNDGLTIIGNKVGFSAQIEIEGLPTLENVETMKKQLENGTISFKEVVDTFYK